MLYPIAIEVGDATTAFGVIIPDVPSCFSAGDTYEESINNAKEALELHFEALAEDGELPPQGSQIDNFFRLPEYNGLVWAVIDINIDPFLGGAIKKNVTLPKLLLKKIDDVVKSNPLYKDRSHFLQVAASRELQH